MLAAIVLGGQSAGYVGPAAQTAPPAIRLRAGTIVPGVQETIPGTEALTTDGYAPGQQGYYIVQFRSAVQDAWRSQLEAAGATVLEYLPDYACTVRMTPELAASLQFLPHINWVGLFQPAFKIAPDLMVNGQRLSRVRIEDGAD